MAHATPTPRARQVRRLHQQLSRAPALPFADLLPAQQVEQALRDEGVTFRDRLFSPLVTLWLFLSQVLDPDGSCRAALARLLAWRAARRLPPCSPDPSAYCKARRRLPEGVLARLTRLTGRAPQDRAPPRWRWGGRTLKVVDGTTVALPDTAANQAAYPQNAAQAPGLGFPIARLVVLFSLAVGTVLDAALGPYQGKQTGETALFHSLQDNLEEGDILLADRYYGSYWELALARRRGCDMVCRLHQRRRADFRRGRRLGPGDHVVSWARPPRPAWMDEATYAALPPALPVRELRVRVRHVGFRTRALVVVTTLLDPAATAAQDVALLYRIRWHAELDLRALKQTLQMDVLRCKSPELARKEVWAHLLAYNLIRGTMAVAARQADLVPLQLSFKGAVQTVNAFAAVLWSASAAELAGLVRQMLEALAQHRVGERANRYEPRAVKRRPKEYPRLTEPRDKARSRLAAVK
jgi:Transposase DDE domain/Insertion element 4 transposase N-terminal